MDDLRKIFEDNNTPKEILFEILLRIEPEFLPDICNINKRTQKYCGAIKNAHYKKYPRIGVSGKDYMVLSDLDILTVKMGSFKNKDYISNRKILTNWLWEVCLEFKLTEKTYILAIKYLDLYAQEIEKFVNSEYQCIGCVCLHLAGQEVNPYYRLKVSDFVYISDDAFNADLFLEKEIEILKILDKFPNPVTVYDYLEKLLEKLLEKPDIDDKFKNIVESFAYYLMVKSLTNFWGVKYPANILALTIYENVIDKYFDKNTKWELIMEPYKYLIGSKIFKQCVLESINYFFTEDMSDPFYNFYNRIQKTLKGKSIEFGKYKKYI